MNDELAVQVIDSLQQLLHQRLYLAYVERLTLSLDHFLELKVHELHHYEYLVSCTTCHNFSYLDDVRMIQTHQHVYFSQRTHWKPLATLLDLDILNRVVFARVHVCASIHYAVATFAYLAYEAVCLDAIAALQ